MCNNHLVSFVSARQRELSGGGGKKLCVRKVWDASENMSAESKFKLAKFKCQKFHHFAALHLDFLT